MNLRDELERLELRGAWAERESFYKELAQSVREKELLLEFANYELRIARSKRMYNPSRAALMEAIRRQYRRGRSTLSEILPAVMPTSDSTTLRVLGDAKNPAAVLENLAQAVADQKTITNLVRKALVQPAIVLVIGSILALVLAKFVFPQIISSAKVDLTGVAAVAAFVARMIASYLLWALGILGFILIFTRVIILPNATGAWRFWLEDLTGASRIALRVLLLPIQPQIEIYREYRSVIMLNNIAVLLQAGKDLLTSLELVAQRGNRWERFRIRQCMNILRANPGEYIRAFESILSGPVLQSLATTVRRGKADFAAELVRGAVRMRSSAETNVAATMGMINKLLVFSVLGTNIFLYLGMVAAVLQLARCHHQVLIHYCPPRYSICQFCTHKIQTRDRHPPVACQRLCMKHLFRMIFVVLLGSAMSVGAQWKDRDGKPHCQHRPHQNRRKFLCPTGSGARPRAVSQNLRKIAQSRGI